MGTISDIIELFKKGYTPPDLIKKGYPRSTVYYAYRKYRKQVEKTLIEQIRPIIHSVLDNGECIRLSITIPDIIICLDNDEIKTYRLIKK